MVYTMQEEDVRLVYVGQSMAKSCDEESPARQFAQCVVELKSRSLTRKAMLQA